MQRAVRAHFLCAGLSLHRAIGDGDSDTAAAAGEPLRQGSSSGSSAAASPSSAGSTLKLGALGRLLLAPGSYCLFAFTTCALGRALTDAVIRSGVDLPPAVEARAVDRMKSSAARCGNHGIIAQGESCALSIAYKLGRASQPPLLQRIGTGQNRLPLISAIGLGLAAAVSRDQKHGLALSTAAAFAFLPAVFFEARAASRGFALMRQAGLEAAAAMKSFTIVPRAAAVVAAPIVGHFAKRFWGGYDHGDNKQ